MKSTRHRYSHKLAGVGFLVSALLAFGQSRDTAQAAGPSGYELSWFSIDGGGAMFSTSGEYELSGTIGQPDASGPMAGPAGSGYELTGGFWFPLVPGDADGDGGITLHDYERFAGCLSGDGSVPPGDCAMLDSDGDGDVDLLDFAAFQRRFSGS